MTGLALAILLFQVQDLRTKECPYVLVTTSGDRVGARDLPNRDGKPVKFHLCANGALTMLPARDVDWAATDAENAAGARATPTPTGVRLAEAGAPTPTPTRATLSGYAKAGPGLDAEAAVKRNAISGKLKVGDREIVMDGTGGFFAQDSVARYLEIGDFVADANGCPSSRAQAYGIVRNVSPHKLHGLRALVAVVGLSSGDVGAQIQAMTPSDLMPGEKADVTLWLSCSVEARTSSYPLEMHPRQSYAAVLLDVAGSVEAVARAAEDKAGAAAVPTATPKPQKPGSPRE